MATNPDRYERFADRLAKWARDFRGWLLEWTLEPIWSFGHLIGITLVLVVLKKSDPPFWLWGPAGFAVVFACDRLRRTAKRRGWMP